MSTIALLCLGHRGLLSKRESTCPQGDFSVIEIGDSTGEGALFLFPFLGLVLAFSPFYLIHIVSLIFRTVLIVSLPHFIHFDFLKLLEFFLFSGHFSKFLVANAPLPILLE